MVKRIAKTLLVVFIFPPLRRRWFLLCPLLLSSLLVVRQWRLVVVRAQHGAMGLRVA